MGATGDLPGRPEGRTYGVPARRARIVELLTEAYARDDLEQAEFERRLDYAEGAGTIEELDDLIADFPEHIRRAAELPVAAIDAPPITGDALNREVTRLDGLSAPTTVNVLGNRHVLLRPQDPRVLRAVSIIGDCTVDLRALAGMGGVVLVKIIAAIGNTRIIVPRGSAVDTRLIGIIGDQKRVRRGGRLMKKLARTFGLVEETERDPAAPPGPTVVVTGFRIIGDTVVIEE